MFTKKQQTLLNEQSIYMYGGAYLDNKYTSLDVNEKMKYTKCARCLRYFYTYRGSLPQHGCYEYKKFI